jgi:hypothetical protein
MHITPKQLIKLRIALQRVAIRVLYRDGEFTPRNEPLIVRRVEPLMLPIIKAGDEPEVRGDVLAWFIETDEVAEYCEPKNGDCSDVRAENLIPVYYVLPEPPTKKTKHVPGVNWNPKTERWSVSRWGRTTSHHYTQEEAVAALVAAGGEDPRKKRKRRRLEPLTPKEAVSLGIAIPKGVSFNKINRRWVARKNGEWLGSFLDPRDAIEALNGYVPPVPAPRPESVEPRPQPAIPKFKTVRHEDNGGYEELFVNGESWGYFHSPSEARAALRDHLYGRAL